MQKLSEGLKIDDLILPQTITVATVGSAYMDMADYRSAIIVVTATLGAGESVTVQATEAEDAAGTGVDNLGDAITLDDTANSIVFLDVKANAMSDDHEFLGISCTPVGGNSEVSVVILRGEPRYEAVTQTVDTSGVVD